MLKAVGTTTATSLLALFAAPGSEAKHTKPPKTKPPKTKNGTCLPPSSPCSFDNVEACCSQFCSTNGCCSLVGDVLQC